ncbi:MAG: hypothetical protein AAF270_13670 [Pseudomonadota bacterium]
MRILPVALASFLLVACGGGGGGATNARPVANAGPDQSVDEQVTVTLDGTASSDAEGGISYSWAQTAGTSVVLNGAGTARAAFESPLLLADEILSFRLTVTDTAGATASDTVAITVIHENLLPSADAGSDQVVLAGSTVTLDGTASSDPEGQLSFNWMQVSGMSVSLSDNAIATPDFSLPISANDYDLEFELTVTDGENVTATDSVLVSAGGVNTGVVRVGTLADATVEFFDAAALESGPVYSVQTANDTAAVPGMITVPTTNRVVASPFAEDQWYLAKVTGGVAIDINGDGIVGGGQTPLLGDVYALLTGDQIVDSDFRITQLTDLSFRRASNRIVAAAESAAIEASLDQTARMHLANDQDGNGIIDGGDISIWDPVSQPGQLRFPERVEALKTLLLSGAQSAEITELGGIRVADFASDSFSASQGLIRRPDSNIFFALGDAPIGIPSMAAIDLSDINAPVELGAIDLASALDSTLAQFGNLVVDGDYVFVVSREKFISIDFSDPVQPVVSDVIDRSVGGLLTLEISEGVAYVAGNEIEIYDVSDPTSIQLVNSVPGFVADLEVSGDVLVTSNGDFVTSYDITIRTTPMMLDAVNLGRAAGSLSVSGDIAYSYATDISVGDLQLLSIDLSDPTSMTVLDRLPVSTLRQSGFSPPIGGDFTVIGDLLYAVGISGFNYVIDISNPLSMDLVGQIPVPPSVLNTNYQKALVDGDQWTVGTRDGFVVLDTLYGQPVFQDGLLTQAFRGELVASGDLVFSLGSSGLQALRTESDGTLTPLDSVSGLPLLASLAVEFPYVYVSSAERTVILDATDPAALTVASEFVQGGVAQQFTLGCVRNSILYKVLTSDAQLIVIDASDPANPIQTAIIPVQPNRTAVADDCGSVLYLAGRGDYETFDIAAAPLAPSRIAANSLQIFESRAIEVDDGLIVVVGDQTIIGSVTSSGAIVSPVAVQKAAVDVQIDQGFIYLASSGLGILTRAADGSVKEDVSVNDVGVWSIAVTENSVVTSDAVTVSFRKAVQTIP